MASVNGHCYLWMSLALWAAGATSDQRDEVKMAIVAVAFHGHYARTSTRFKQSGCSDFFAAVSNHRRTIFAPLVQTGRQVVTLFHTYHNSGCPIADETLVRVLEPLAFRFDREPLPRIVDSFIAVLKLAYLHADQAHAILLVRFDVLYTAPITRWGISWPCFNIAYRDVRWEQQQKTSDLLFVIPTALTQHLIHALNVSGRRGHNGPGHWVVPAIREQAPQVCIHFIEDGEFKSNAMWKRSAPWNPTWRPQPQAHAAIIARSAKRVPKVLAPYSNASRDALAPTERAHGKPSSSLMRITRACSIATTCSANELSALQVIMIHTHSVQMHRLPSRRDR
mmetsp:Transcript_10578/g.28745  ORF Transcript_10578/g.28745 Transcript_10578/m.28745 type:complete len:337 (+) Transcript_10578:22-1032(+)